MEKILNTVKKIVPAKILQKIRPAYHYLLALAGAVIYRFPSRKIFVVAVTGTKGKTSTTEITAAILEEAGFKVASMGTLKFKIGKTEKRNLYKMTMPGRLFVQKFLREAVDAGCDYAVVEMTSEGARQFRHKFTDLDALIFTNIAREHIESHGSFENYLAAKLSIAKELENSKKRRTIMVANSDDEQGKKFLAVKAKEKYAYGIRNAEAIASDENGSTFTFENHRMKTSLPGIFNIYNILAAATFAQTQGVPLATIKKAVEKIGVIRGRMEKVESGNPKQNFAVVVDYAHTPDSLLKAYEVYKNKNLICVLGNTGGGRDKWKRKEMGQIADRHCSEIFLTDEDPYDEDPRVIVEQVKEGISKKPCRIIMDRREAIRTAIESAAKTKDSVVLITGKGTDPYIMKAGGEKLPWSDYEVAKEEILKVLK